MTEFMRHQGSCVNCFKKIDTIDLINCQRCRNATYCSQLCAEKDWTNHKDRCAEFLTKQLEISSQHGNDFTRTVEYFKNCNRLPFTLIGKFLIPANEDRTHSLFIDAMYFPHNCDLKKIQIVSYDIKPNEYFRVYGDQIYDQIMSLNLKCLKDQDPNNRYITTVIYLSGDSKPPICRIFTTGTTLSSDQVNVLDYIEAINAGEWKSNS
jgi:hypothetical protein